MTRVGVGAGTRVLVVRIDTDQVQGSETHPTLGANPIGEGANLPGIALQHDTLKGMIVVEVHLRGGCYKVVVGVPKVGEPLGEGADPSVENV